MALAKVEFESVVDNVVVTTGIADVVSVVGVAGVEEFDKFLILME